MIYKIFRDDEYRELLQNSQTEGSADDKRDGFIHFSSVATLAGTLEKYFSGESKLWLVFVQDDGLTHLEWEPSRGGVLFPHLYAPLRADQCVKAVQFDAKDGLPL